MGRIGKESRSIPIRISPGSDDQGLQGENDPQRKKNQTPADEKHPLEPASDQRAEDCAVGRIAKSVLRKPVHDGLVTLFVQLDGRIG